MNDDPAMDIAERIKLVLAEFENVNPMDATVALASVMVWYVFNKVGVDGRQLTLSELQAGCHDAIDIMIELAEQRVLLTRTEVH